MSGAAPRADAIGEGPLAVLCGGGAFPPAVADTGAASGRKVVLFPLDGWADPAFVARYPHHWIKLGQFGRFIRLARQEGCRDVVFIGTVLRPSVWQLRLDLTTLLALPRVARILMSGGDDRLLGGYAAMFEEKGFRLLGAHQVAPQILVPEGSMARRAPSAQDRADIARALAALRAIGPFDVGQAAVVAQNRVLALEAAEGTDGMLGRVAELRRVGRIRTAVGTGVLVKAPKPGQDHRFDLPSIGPLTVEGVARAGLGGIAVVAGAAIVAEPAAVAAAADAAGLFVVGVRDAGAAP